jgi:proline racemase
MSPDGGPTLRMTVYTAEGQQKITARFSLTAEIGSEFHGTHCLTASDPNFHNSLTPFFL